MHSKLKNMFRRENSPMWVLVLLYGMLVLSQLFWGLPNQQRLYVYHMDEWHQMQSVRNVFRYGTPNVAGSANGTMGHFLISGVLSLPMLVFVRLVTGSFDVLSNLWQWQRALFVYLRLETVIFGVASVVAFAYLLRRHFPQNQFWGLYFFVMSGGWLSFSGYFKYDIALIFWMILALSKILDYGKSGSMRDYVFAGIMTGMATATKVSTPPLILLYVVSFWLYTPRKKLGIWLAGLGVLTLVVLALGVPDLLLGLGDYREYLLSNLVWNPQAVTDWNYVWWQKLLMAVLNIESVVGVGAMMLACLGIVQVQWRNILRSKNELIVLGWVGLFGLSLVVLGWYAFGNRMLVVLPGLAIMAGWGVGWLQKRRLDWIVLVLVLIQAISAVSWVVVKWQPDPREKSYPVLNQVLENQIAVGYLGNAIYEMWPDAMFMRWVDEQRTGESTMVLVDMAGMINTPDYVIVTDTLPGRLIRGIESNQVLSWMDQQGYELVEQERATLPSWYWWIYDSWQVLPPRLVPQPFDISVFRLSEKSGW